MLDEGTILNIFKDVENESNTEYAPFEREPSSNCVHRVPYEGRKMVLECFPSYFKVGMLLATDEGNPLPKNNKSFFSNWWKKKETNSFDPSKLNVVPRFVVFEDGFLMFLRYHKPH